MSKSVAQLSYWNDVLNRHIQADRFTNNDKFVCSSSVRATSKAHQSKDISMIENASEESNKEDAQVVVDNNKRYENAKTIMKENEEAWIKPMKCASIAYFYKRK